MSMDNFIIDRVKRGVMFSNVTGEARWALNQPENFNLKVTTDKQEVVDALGTPVQEFYRGKKGEATGQASFLNLTLLAEQSGSEKIVAAAGTKMDTPVWEEITVTKVQETSGLTLRETPMGLEGSEIGFIYVMSNDGTIQTKYKQGATANTTDFQVTGKTVKLPTPVKEGARVWVPYTAAVQSGVGLDNNADKFPKAGRFVLEVLGHDVCDAETVYYAYVVCPNAELASDIDLTLAAGEKHPFTLSLLQDYCSANKQLFYVRIPDVAPQG